MGQCKKCNQIYGAHEMVNGICKNCLTPEDIQNSKPSENSDKQLMDLYKVALKVNKSILILFPLIIISTVTNFGGIVLIFVAIGHILSLTTIFELYKTKKHKNELKKLLTYLLIVDSLFLLVLWGFSNANFHA